MTTDPGADLTVFGPLYAQPRRGAVPVTWHVRDCLRCAVRWRGDVRSVCWNCRELPACTTWEFEEEYRLRTLIESVYGWSGTL